MTNQSIVSRHMLSILNRVAKAPRIGYDWPTDDITSRNYFLLAIYLRSRSHIPTSNNYLSIKPESMSAIQLIQPAREAPTQVAQLDQSVIAGEDRVVHDSPAVDSPRSSSSSQDTQFTASASPSAITTTTPGSTISNDTADRSVSCKQCGRRFKLGKKGKAGQASNLGKHMRAYHPDALPNHKATIYECQYGCGRRDPAKSNIKIHEQRHCPRRKGKISRRNRKYDRRERSSSVG
jgi:hypothetical protein